MSSQDSDNNGENPPNRRSTLRSGFRPPPRVGYFGDGNLARKKIERTEDDDDMDVTPLDLSVLHNTNPANKKAKTEIKKSQNDMSVNTSSNYLNSTGINKSTFSTTVIPSNSNSQDSEDEPQSPETTPRIKLEGNKIPERTKFSKFEERVIENLSCEECRNTCYQPIYSCKKNHFTCNFCMLTCKSCPKCNSKFSMVRHKVFEQIVGLLEIECPSPGCDIIMPSEDISEHQLNCRFRPILCCETLNKKCSNTVSSRQEYSEHLRRVHLIPYHTHRGQGWESAQRFDALQDLNNKAHLIKAVGADFFIKFKVKNRAVLTIQAFLLGSSAEAEAYEAQIILKHPSLIKVYPTLIYKSNIPSVYEINDKNLEQESFSINKASLTTFCAENRFENGKTWNYKFQLRIYFKKKESANGNGVQVEAEDTTTDTQEEETE